MGRADTPTPSSFVWDAPLPHEAARLERWRASWKEDPISVPSRAKRGWLLVTVGVAAARLIRGSR